MIDRSGSLWVLGANGLLGSHMSPALQKKGYKVITHRAQGPGTDLEVDLTDWAQLQPVFDAAAQRHGVPCVLINLVALTDVDQCEQAPHQAYCLNTQVVEHLVQWLQHRAPQTHLIHISTDQVYDAHGASTEDQVHITNTYALSKYAGELAALRVPSTVLRTNFVGKSQCEHRQTLSDWLVQCLQQNTRMTVFEDVWFSPLDLEQLCSAIVRVVQSPISGVFNLGAKSGISKADFAEQLAQGLGLSFECAKRDSVATMSFKANRPSDMRLNVTRFEQAFEYALPDMHQVMQRVISAY